MYDRRRREFFPRIQVWNAGFLFIERTRIRWIRGGGVLLFLKRRSLAAFASRESGWGFCYPNIRSGTYRCFHLSISKNLVKSGKKKSPRKQEPTMSDASGGWCTCMLLHFPPGRVPSLPRGFAGASRGAAASASLDRSPR
jgi:hypothetical protein